MNRRGIPFHLHPRPRWKRILRSPLTFYLFYRVARTRTNEIVSAPIPVALRIAMIFTRNSWRRA